MANAAAARLSWAGLFTGPAALGLTFAVNYTLVPWQCAHKLYPAPIVSVGGIVLALLGAFVSLLAWRNVGQPSEQLDQRRTARFLAGVGIGAGCLFALVMALQLLAGVVFEGCE